MSPKPNFCGGARRGSPSRGGGRLPVSFYRLKSPDSFLLPSPRSRAKETVRKGALWRRPRGKASFKIEPEGFDHIDDDDGEYTSVNCPKLRIEGLAYRALKTYQDYHCEQYKFVSLEKAAMKRNTDNYYLTFIVTAENDDVKTVQAIIKSIYYKSAFVYYVKMIPASPSTKTCSPSS